MVKNKFSNNQFWFVSFLLLLILMLAVTLYPYNFSPPANGTEWLINKSGLYFNGKGIAYTDKRQIIPPQKQVSIEILLQERPGSKNWGPRDIFSFYDGKASPPLLIGQWDRRIFLFSRFESNKGEKWYKLFQSKKGFQRGKPHLVTVTFGGFEKAIYIDGKLINKNIIETDIKISGRLIIGNSPTNKNGWWGEIRGLAIYDRLLSPNEIKSHSAEVSSQGMHMLASVPGCLGLYTFEEGEGNIIESIVGDNRPFYIPAQTFSIPETIFHYPHKDMRIESLFGALVTKDFGANILFFFPYGVLLSVILLRNFHFSYFPSFLIVILTGGLFSFSIEFTQLFLPTRTAGILDISSNMLGSGLGFLLPYLLKLRT